MKKGSRSLTFGVIQRVHVSVDVALQVGVEARCGGEEGQTDGHQLPASLQAVIAEVLCGLTTQLDVELITQTLITPPAHHHLTDTVTQGQVSGDCSSPLHDCVFMDEKSSLQFSIRCDQFVEIYDVIQGADSHVGCITVERYYYIIRDQLHLQKPQQVLHIHNLDPIDSR